MPRCPECYTTLSYDRLDRHLSWCCAAGGHHGKAADGMESLAGRLEGVEHRIERRIEAIEAELDRVGPPMRDERPPERSDELPPPPT